MIRRALLIEDEEPSRSRLRGMLDGFRSQVTIVGEATNGIEAIEQIRALCPDLLFLDIGLPGLDGFKVLESLEIQPSVIFTTSHDEYALRAFQSNTVDYLLKPIEQESLKRSIDKLRPMGFDHDRLSQTLEQIAGALINPYLTRLTCRVGDKFSIVKVDEIVYFQSDSKYTAINTSSRQYLEETPLIELERRLNPREFVRIHRSTIVNIHWIAEIQKLFDGKMKVVMKDAKASQLFASRSYADRLKSL